MRASPERSRVVVCAGPRCAESRLLAEVETVRPLCLEELSSPLRVVVPSRSLRLHVARVLTSKLGATAGVVVQTVHGIASEIASAGEGCPVPREALFDLLYQRETAREPRLAEFLGSLDGGFSCAAGTIRDLLDAGLEFANAEAAMERIGELQSSVGERALGWAEGLLRVATRVRDSAEELGSCRAADRMKVAAERLWSEPGALAARAVIVHGFADVTGLVGDFLQAVSAVAPAVFLLDRPRDPAAGDREDSGCAFLDRLQLKLSGLDEICDEKTPDPPMCRVGVAAEDPEGEARRAATDIRKLLDAGFVPESIGVVARDLSPYAFALRRHLDRLGVPFSGHGAMVPGGRTARWARGLGRVLREGRRSPLDLWFEVACAGDATDLVLGLRVLGVRRLDDLASLTPEDVGADGVALPAGVIDPDDESDDGPLNHLPRERVVRAIEDARNLVMSMDGLEAQETAEDWFHLVVSLVERFGAKSGDAQIAGVTQALQELAGELPPDLVADHEELVDLAEARLSTIGEVPIGGSGGGVQVLTVMEARGRTFEHLFVLGLNRGAFPRVIHEDSLLRDTVRGHLARDVLPDLPVKARGADEERYLFAQLVAAAPHVRLSWSSAASGVRTAPSPFVERLRLADMLDVNPEAFEGSEQTPVRGPLPAADHVVTAALARDREPFEDTLALSLREGRRRAGMADDPAAAAAVASVHVEVLEALEEPGPHTSPGPWSGLVGESSVDVGPTAPVTRLERFATCPWQHFVTQRLRVRPMPDPGSELPGIEGLIVGRVVHRMLELVARRSLGPRPQWVDAVLETMPVAIVWPPDPILETQTREIADREARAAGVAVLGAGPLIAERALGLLRVARRVGFEELNTGTVGVEIVGEVAASDGLIVEFRADRVDLREKVAVLVDYKSGRPLSGAARAETRRRHLIAAVARGRKLQTVAYAQAAPGAFGAYVFLRPEIGSIPEEARRMEVSADDAEAVVAFDVAVRTLSEAWRAGVAFPRVEEVKPPGRRPPHCEYCAVAEACRRDDSAFRARLVGWLSDTAGQGTADPATRAARALWFLGTDTAGPAP